jgi:hypothetical protein
LLAAGLILGLAGCDGDDGDNGGNVPEWAKGFYNYPTGRVDSNRGLLAIENKIAFEVLLFTGEVVKENYIGTVSPLGKVNIRLPEEKFYTIVAVEKNNYIERRGQASQFSTLTYHSNTQAYTIPVTPMTTYGGGNWVFNNYTNYWVQVKNTDQSQNWAVIAPMAQRVSVPIPMNTIYNYHVYFSRELKYNGKTIALVDSNNIALSNSIQVTDANPTQVLDITTSNIPNASVKPAVMVINDSNKGIRVFYSSTPKTNGAPGGDFIVSGGLRNLVVGFEVGDVLSNINFDAIAWQGTKRYVPNSTTMAASTIYEIRLPASEVASEITVTPVDASTYLD